MKNLILHIAGGCLCFVASATYGQVNNHVMFTSPKTSQEIADTSTIRASSGYLNNINSRAMRDFVSMYKDATEVKWYPIKDGYSARCLLNNIPANMVYNRRGNWMYTIHYCKEHDLPADVRAVIKSSYYDYSITQVEKILLQKTDTIYWVHMKDANSFKIVKVCGGAMDVAEDYRKSN